MALRLFGVACGVSLVVAGSLGAENRTSSPPRPNASRVSVGEPVGILRVVPYQSEKPRIERAIRVVLEPLTVPDGPRGNSIIDVCFAAAFSRQLSENWEVAALDVYELGAAEKTIRRADSFYVNPSHCNDYCNGEVRYSVTGVKAGHRYRAEYLLTPKRSDVEVSSVITSLRSPQHDALTVKARYEFAVPYDHGVSADSDHASVDGTLSGH
jgi:hypothetical protein